MPRRDCKQGKRFSSLFRCGSYIFEDRATLWRRDMAPHCFVTTGVCAARSAAAKFWGLMMLKVRALAFLTLLKAKRLEKILMLLKR